MSNHLQALFLSPKLGGYFVILLVVSLTFSLPVNSQIHSEQEEQFAYEVKQLDEFFERFNNESTLIVNFLQNTYQLKPGREELLLSLFDLKSDDLEKDVIVRFIDFVNKPEKPVLLNFYDHNWYARLKCAVVYEDQERELHMLLRVQQEEDGGSKWVIQQVYADFLKSPDENDPAAFLNPMSHATDFMGLSRAFEQPEKLKGYLSADFEDNQLSKLMLEMQHKRIAFQHVEEISYHFFQVEGWVFTVENFQRPEKNAGWLISSLEEADAEEKEMIKQTLLSDNI